MENKFYIYAHYKPNEERPFYVGKGRKKRGISKTNRTKHWHNIVNKYFPDTKFPIIKFLSKDIEDEQLSFDLEKFWIALFGRKDLGTGVLINKTDGGEGVCGLKQSPTTKQLISRQRGFQGCWMFHPEYGKHWCEQQKLFCEQWNLHFTNFNKVILYQRRHCEGWQRISETTPGLGWEQLKTIIKNNCSRGQNFKGCWLIHPVHGSQWCENQHEFSKRWDLEVRNLNKVIKGTRKHHHKWQLKGS